MHATPADVLSAYSAAVRAAAVPAFLDCYAEDVVVFDAFAPSPFENRERWAVQVNEWLEGQGPDGGTAEFSDVRVIESGDTAGVHALARYSTTATGEGSGMWNRYSAVLRRVDGGWLVVHEHTSVPVHLETGEALLGDDEESLGR